MKKLFGILAVSAFLFASCGGNSDKEAKTDSTATQPVVTEEPAPVVEETVDTTVVAETPAETPVK